MSHRERMIKMLRLGVTPKISSNHKSPLSSSPFNYLYTAAATTCRFPTATAPFHSSTIKMSSSTTTATSVTQIVEHFVLFKVKPDTDPSKVNDMVSNLSALTSLDTVLHLTVGPVFRNRSSSLTFTHMLHSRYASKPDLEAYAAHPDHVGVVVENVRPICEDVMAVDWVYNEVKGPVKIHPGSAIRVTFLKLKEGSGDTEKNEVLEVIGGLKEKFAAVEQLSYGENFSPGRAKGYSIGSLAVFKGMNELEAVDMEKEAATEEKDKVRDKLDGVVVLDYVVSSPPSASL